MGGGWRPKNEGVIVCASVCFLSTVCGRAKWKTTELQSGQGREDVLLSKHNTNYCPGNFSTEQQHHVQVFVHVITTETRLLFSVSRSDDNTGLCCPRIVQYISKYMFQIAFHSYTCAYTGFLARIYVERLEQGIFILIILFK